MSEPRQADRSTVDSPLCMAGQVTLARNQTLPVAMEALDGVARNWLEMRELRVTIQPLGQPDLTPSVGSQLNGLGSIVEVRLKSGRNYLTKDFVPVCLLGPTIIPRFEFSPQSVFQTGAPATPAMINAEHYSWTFSKPMLCGPGTPLDCEVRRLADTQGLDPAWLGPVRVTVSLAGKKFGAPRGDTMRDVPWAMHFRPPVAQYTAGTTFPDVVADELTLRNPFRRPLRIQRVNFRVAEGADNGTNGQPGGQIQRDGLSGATAGNCFKLRLRDGYSNQIYEKTNQQSPDNVLFPTPAADMYMTAQMNSVMIGDMLLPGQWYRATIGRYLDTNDLTSFVPMLALVGDRQEPMR